MTQQKSKLVGGGLSKKQSVANCTEALDQDCAETEAGDSPVTLNMVRDKAMELLARREHSRVELQTKLQQRDYPEDFIVSVLDDFARRNLQSDERFAEVYVRSRVSRGYGELKIRAELLSRGLTGDRISLALEASDSNWYELAEALLTKKFLPRVDPESVRSQMIRGKMQRFLQNRGYTPDQIISAVNRMADIVTATDEVNPQHFAG